MKKELIKRSEELRAKLHKSLEQSRKMFEEYKKVKDRKGF